MDKLDKNAYEEYRNYLDSIKDQPKKGMEMIILQKIQEVFGYIPKEILLETSKETGIAATDLYGVASFYHQFSFNPKGKYSINICLGTACYVKGSGAVLKEIEEIIGIKDGKVTEDGKYSIDTSRCIGACGLAPVKSIDDKIYGKVTVEGVRNILQDYEEADHE